MISYSSSVTIGRPPDEVWTYLIEPAKAALWSDVPMRRLTDGPLGAGSRMEVTFGMGPLKARIGLELIAVEPGGLLAFRSFSGPIGWDGEYRLVAVGDGSTEISQEGRLTFSGAWRLLEPMVGAEIKTGEIKELETLKSVIESA